MRISSKGRYALRLMIDLAEHREDGYIPLRDIATRQSISKKYLEQIIPVFNKPGILKTARGNQGGYMLAKPPCQYKIGDILRLTEGSFSPVECINNEPVGCERSAICPTLPIWQGLNDVINEYLDAITLQDILEQQKERHANESM